MDNRREAARQTNQTREVYETPELKVIGDATDVVLGVPGGGADGPYGMSEPQFEFEPDGDAG